MLIDPLVPAEADGALVLARRACRQRRRNRAGDDDGRLAQRSRAEVVARYGAATGAHEPPRRSRAGRHRRRGRDDGLAAGCEGADPGDRLLGDGHGGLRLCPQSWLGYLDRPPSLDELRRALRPLLDLDVQRVLVSHGAAGDAATARARFAGPSRGVDPRRLRHRHRHRGRQDRGRRGDRADPGRSGRAGRCVQAGGERAGRCERAATPDHELLRSPRARPSPTTRSRPTATGRPSRRTWAPSSPRADRPGPAAAGGASGRRRRRRARLRGGGGLPGAADARLPGPRSRARPRPAGRDRRHARAGDDQPHAADGRGRPGGGPRGRGRRPTPMARAGPSEIERSNREAIARGWAASRCSTLRALDLADPGGWPRCSGVVSRAFPAAAARLGSPQRCRGRSAELDSGTSGTRSRSSGTGARTSRW